MSSMERCSQGSRLQLMVVQPARGGSPPTFAFWGTKGVLARGGEIHPPLGLSGTAATINIPKSLVRCSEGPVGAGSETWRCGLGPCSDTGSLISVIRKCFRRVNEGRYKELWLSL